MIFRVYQKTDDDTQNQHENKHNIIDPIDSKTSNKDKCIMTNSLKVSIVYFCALRVLFTHINRCACVCKKLKIVVPCSVSPIMIDQMVYRTVRSMVALEISKNK